MAQAVNGGYKCSCQRKGQYCLVRQFRYLLIVVEVAQLAKMADGGGLLQQHLNFVKTAPQHSTKQRVWNKQELTSRVESW